MHFAFFPSELIDEIVEHTEDTEDIESLCLVAQRFVIPSQRCLFHTIILTASGPACNNLHSLFTTSPHLAGYVRNFVVNLSGVGDSGSLAVLAMLGGLKCLSLTGTYYENIKFSWTQISPAIRSSICRAIQTSTIQTLYLDSIDGIPSALLHYAVGAFSQLTLICVGVSDANLEPPLQMHDEASRLGHLTIVGSGQLLHAFMTHIDVRRAIRHLTRLNMVLDDAGWEFLGASPFLASLEHLVLTWGFYPTERMHHPLDLPFLPNVRKFCLDIVAFSWEEALTFIGSFINLAERTPALENLQLILEPSIQLTGQSPTDPFPLFDTRLYAQRLPYLRHVNCSMREEGSVITLDAFASYMGAKLPGPLADGILTCGTYQPGCDA